MLDLAERLVDLSCFDRVWLGSSGAEVNEAAVKLARRWGQPHARRRTRGDRLRRRLPRPHAGDDERLRQAGLGQLFAPMPTGFAKARYNDIASVERAITPASVAVMIELVQGEAGVHLADPGFVRELRALTTERRLLLIADEVQTGIGRCGRSLRARAVRHRARRDDAGQGLGGGVPLAALLCKEAFNCFAPGDQGGTFGGNPLMAAVGLAVVGTVCQDSFLAQVRQRAAHLARGLQAIVQDHGLVAEAGPACCARWCCPPTPPPRWWQRRRP